MTEPQTVTATRKSALDICLPELCPLVDRWRLPTVPGASLGVPPHITLLYPWRAAPVGQQDLDEAAAALAGVPPLTVTFRRLGRFPTAVYLVPEPEDVLRRLIRRLVAAFPDTPPYGGQFADPTPHLTVAKAATEVEAARLEDEIARHLAPHLPLVYPVRALAVEEEGADGRWSTRSVIRLAA